MKKIEISSGLARKLVVNAQLLDGTSDLPDGKERSARIIERLGYVQINTLAVINRSHHHTLWTRQQDYRKEMLHDLQAKDRRIFEYWGHAMSYLPMSDYRFALPRMRNFYNPVSRWAKYQMEKCGHLLEPVLDRVKKEGPLSSRDFKKPAGKKSGSWWDWKPAKVALELLMWRGDLMVTERKNFQKVYDLTERVLPDDIDTRIPEDEEIGQFLVRRSLTAFGLVTQREIANYLQPEASRDADLKLADAGLISDSLNHLVESGEAVPVSIENAGKQTYYTFADSMHNSENPDIHPKPIHLLSPFDNLVIQRDRLSRLFNFKYALECYLPAAKRIYGYFVMPILWGTEFVGRLDPKADRKKKTLFIYNLVFETDFEDFGEFLPDFADKLRKLAHFNQCDKIQLEKVSPSKIKSELKKFLR